MEKLIHRRVTKADSEALCDLLRETPMGESIRTVQDRGNDFFAASQLQATDLEIWAAFEENSGRAAGIFSAGSRKVFLHGEVKSVRYLSDLRIRQEYRSGLLLARGFKLLRREVFADGDWAQSLILDDNSDAAKLLISGRGGLPEYQPHGTYKTWFLRDQEVPNIDKDIHVRRAEKSDLEAMQHLQEQFGPSADYTPILNFESMDDVEFILAFKNQKPVGLLGIWDTSSYKSTVIQDFNHSTRLLRPFYNLWATARNLPRLPAVQQPISAKALTAIFCQNRDPIILRTLLASALQSPGLFAIGLDTSDPLASALTDLRSRTTTATHYLVGFSGQPPQSNRPFYFDFARL